MLGMRKLHKFIWAFLAIFMYVVLLKLSFVVDVYTIEYEYVCLRRLRTYADAQR